jgi:hypothetical protein
VTTWTEVTEVETVSVVVPPDEVRTCETDGEVTTETVDDSPYELMMVVAVVGANGDDEIIDEPVYDSE